MTDDFDLQQARKQLEQLGQRIQAGKTALSKPGTMVADEIERRWKEMERRHEELSGKLQTGAVAGSQAAETLRRDIDELRHGFSRWAAEVERRFDNGSRRT